MWSILQSVECSPAERGILLAHAALLDSGYRLKRPAHTDSQGIHMTILPSDWKSVAPKYAFAYDNLDMQALVVGNEVNVHVSKPDGDLISVTLLDTESTTWADKVKTHLVDKVKAAETRATPAGPSRPAEPTVPVGTTPQRPPRQPWHPFEVEPNPLLDTRMPQRPQFFTPDGRLFDPNPSPFGPQVPNNWVGPNDPRWGPMIDRNPRVPGMMPRYDPIGPGNIGGDPDNDIIFPTRFGSGLPDYIG
eukprot:GEMP01056879.1.p1 GENE.GEMP01056879.1~~GEMP01056879.1.p1  ORF type:complete len:260 (+),score=32.48 GEMP01056879.1:41-781(+)